jgi:hypothetical protein
MSVVLLPDMSPKSLFSTVLAAPMSSLWQTRRSWPEGCPLARNRSAQRGAQSRLLAQATARLPCHAAVERFFFSQCGHR